MVHRFLLCMFLVTLAGGMVASAQPAGLNYDGTGESWSWVKGRKRAVGRRTLEWTSPTFLRSDWAN